MDALNFFQIPLPFYLYAKSYSLPLPSVHTYYIDMHLTPPRHFMKTWLILCRPFVC